jgi:branched-chain amino acid transport system ATP-binding protein
MKLVVKNLSVHHGAILALNDVSFEIESEKITAIIGANGAGKSTLLRTISGLNRATSGSISWNGQEISNSRTEQIVRGGIVQVAEGKSVVPELGVEENLILGAIWRRDKKEAKDSLSTVFDLFPKLAERRNQRADTLSGGERQMLAIGRTIMAKPKLLLLDEPSLGLAPIIVDQIFGNIQSLSRDLKITVALVEQNALGALNIADYGLVLNLGEVVAKGKAQVLLNDDSLRAAYLGY